MRILRWVLIVWSFLGGAGAGFLFIVFLDALGASAVEVGAALLWAVMYVLNLVYLLRSVPKGPGGKV